jgi:ABC-type polysaccharide/polyol phosphate transport system ATPase subunit
MAALVVDDVYVEFPVYGSQRSLRRALLERATVGMIYREKRGTERVVVRALAGVSLTCRDGDRIGLVGHNGAGKSTLLRVMAGIYEPTRGRVLAQGRITPLFDTMPGLDGEDSGYENIITAGSLHGLTREEIERIIPDIEQFSELGEYLTLPYRTYSSGMGTRLAFSIATALHPEILLMDEGIGAGDARFAERAARRMDEFMGKSRILVLASHSEHLLRATCNAGVLLQSGTIIASGTLDEVFERYRASTHEPVAG